MVVVNVWIVMMRVVAISVVEGITVCGGCVGKRGGGHSRSDGGVVAMVVMMVSVVVITFMMRD